MVVATKLLDQSKPSHLYHPCHHIGRDGVHDKPYFWTISLLANRGMSSEEDILRQSRKIGLVPGSWRWGMRAQGSGRDGTTRLPPTSDAAAPTRSRKQIGNPSVAGSFRRGVYSLQPFAPLWIALSSEVGGQLRCGKTIGRV